LTQKYSCEREFTACQRGNARYRSARFFRKEKKIPRKISLTLHKKTNHHNNRNNPMASSAAASAHLSGKLLDPYIKKLDEDGYVVIPRAVSADRARELADQFWTWIEDRPKDKVNKPISRDDPDTWNPYRFVPALNGIIKTLRIGHAQFVWDARVEPGVLAVYERLFNTTDLLVSYDGANISVPNAHEAKKWNLHVDQAPVTAVNGVKKRDFTMYQSFLNLLPCGDDDGGFVVYKGFHKQHVKYFDEKGAMTEAEAKKQGMITKAKPYDEEHPPMWKDSEENWHVLGQKDPVAKKYLGKCERVKVNCQPGDLVLWNSRCAHQASGIDPSKVPADRHRMVIYISMLPRSMATQKDLDRKKRYLECLRTTSHWACVSLSVNGERPRIYSAEQREFVESFSDPDTPPVLTARMKQLCGLRADETVKFTPGESIIASSSGKKRGKEESASASSKRSK
jgi:hypothetical protein